MNIKHFMYCNCISFAQVKYSEKQKSFGHFASGLCAIIGEYSYRQLYTYGCFYLAFFCVSSQNVAKTEMM
jgi:hypothetical protein